MTTTSGSGVAGMQIDEDLPEFLRIPPSDIQIGEQIGQGGFARVHKASWNGIQCAAKIVQSANVFLIQREVAILSKLQHPNVVRCIGFSVDSVGDPRQCMILMELLDTDLREVMNERLQDKADAVPFEEEEALDILIQIAAGMEYLHGLRVFHGDLKASNVLVSRGLDGKIHVKITDFGVSQMAKLDAGETSEEFIKKKYFHGVVGTRGYQAPEVSSSSYIRHNFRYSHGTSTYLPPENFEPERRNKEMRRKSDEYYTAKADVYCYAITCYEILSGHVPFESVRKPEIPALVLGGARPVLPHGLDERLVGLIKRCWDQKPTRRPAFNTIGRSLQMFAEESGSEIFYSQKLMKKRRARRLALQKFSEQPSSKGFSLQTFPEEPGSKGATNCWGRLLSRFRRGMWK